MCFCQKNTFFAEIQIKKKNIVFRFMRLNKIFNIFNFTLYLRLTLYIIILKPLLIERFNKFKFYMIFMKIRDLGPNHFNINYNALVKQ